MRAFFIIEGILLLAVLVITAVAFGIIYGITIIKKEHKEIEK